MVLPEGKTFEFGNRSIQRIGDEIWTSRWWLNEEAKFNPEDFQQRGERRTQLGLFDEVDDEYYEYDEEDDVKDDYFDE